MANQVNLKTVCEREVTVFFFSDDCLAFLCILSWPSCMHDVVVVLSLSLSDEQVGCLTSEHLAIDGIDGRTCVGNCGANHVPVDGKCQPCDGPCPKGFVHVSLALYYLLLLPVPVLYLRWFGAGQQINHWINESLLY